MTSGLRPQSRGEAKRRANLRGYDPWGLQTTLPPYQRTITSKKQDLSIFTKPLESQCYHNAMFEKPRAVEHLHLFRPTRAWRQMRCLFTAGRANDPWISVSRRPEALIGPLARIDSL